MGNTWVTALLHPLRGGDEGERRRATGGVWFESAEEYEQHFRNVMKRHQGRVTTKLLNEKEKFHELVNALRVWGLKVGVELNKRFDEHPTAAVSELLEMMESLDIVGWCRFFSLLTSDFKVAPIFLESDDQALKG